MPSYSCRWYSPHLLFSPSSLPPPPFSPLIYPPPLLPSSLPLPPLPPSPPSPITVSQMYILTWVCEMPTLVFTLGKLRKLSPAPRTVWWPLIIHPAITQAEGNHSLALKRAEEITDRGMQWIFSLIHLLSFVWFFSCNMFSSGQLGRNGGKCCFYMWTYLKNWSILVVDFEYH